MSNPLKDGLDTTALVTTPRPLVSCIMPTYQRRMFVPQAIYYFLRQDYPERELIVVDDGSDSVADLLPVDTRIRYLRLSGKQHLGTKRNLACQEAQGNIIVHWDDDDWMAPWRLRYQVDSLLTTEADICGLNTLIFYDPRSRRAWQYQYPRKTRPLVAGGSLCYRKHVWEDNPFPAIDLGEDMRFVSSKQPKRITVLEDNRFYVAISHPGNTNPRVTTGRRWSSYGNAKIRDLIGNDMIFYNHLYGNERGGK